MTLPISGQLKASQINAELGLTTSTQISLSQTRTLAGIPTGAIRFSDLLGKSTFSLTQFTTAGAQSFTVPAGITTFKVLLIGGGAGGGNGSAAAAGAGGGAGEVKTVTGFAVQGGDTLTVTVGAGGLSAARGVNTTVKNLRTGVTITANSGFAGTSGVSTTGGTGGASIGQNSVTYYGGTGNTSGGAGGGAGPTANGGAPSGSQGGAAATGITATASTNNYLVAGAGAGGGATAGAPASTYGGGTGGATGTSGGWAVANTGGGGGGAGIGAGLTGGRGASGLVVLYV